ncbi:TIGR04283 family arsenosugar biosynthesis glycosyltransferase [Neptunicoccus cionae]|uniref:TIGR04283 family arsenosugar biosynthesis glycosyltransferase n=1 Tax=Neptunicoccus cionae TaxID=2035344 RepID=UPI000C775E4A|nr:TIGR04283 family arsenosugar biosynthesis glycosyltransferase [Amylibacter cionae]PLS23584.1 glycosyl transferase [Amylibacter cionae]
MTAPITVIIPTLNSAHTLGPTLASLFDGVAAGLVHQVIFADGGSTDGTDHIAEETGVDFHPSAPGRGIQMAGAARTATTQWLLFLHSDTVLSEDWTSAVRSHVESRTGAAYFRLRFDSSGPAATLVAAWANLRASLFGLPYGDQGLLLPASLYSKTGGFPEIPLMEDVALARKLRGQLSALDATATTSAVKYREQGWLKRGTRNLTTLALYFLGMAPEKLAQRYARR